MAGYSDTHCLQTSLLIFKFCQPRNKESFVSTANKPLVGTLMTIDVTVSIAIGLVIFLFFLFMDLDSVSVHKQAKKELTWPTLRHLDLTLGQ